MGVTAVGVLPVSVPAGIQAQIRGMRLATSRSRTRLVLDTTEPVEYSLFTLQSPERIVIDIRSSVFADGAPKLLAGGSVQRIRSARRNGGDLRVVLELKRQVKTKSFLLPPNGDSGHRLVIDLSDAGSHTLDNFSADDGKPLRDVIVAIDAGHGGKDPGASGRGRTREKHITLAVARHLQRILNGIHGIKPVMIRDKDVFVSLRERINIARRHQVDLFVSIHADAFHDRRASGASVYALSNRGATSEAAQWLANKENAADLAGGVSIRNHSDVVAEILLDLAQSATIQSSLDVGAVVLKNLGRVGRVHKSKVEQAGFAVLKSPDIPSILIETAFISNPREERKLLTDAYQKKLADAIAKGIGVYFERQAPPGTILSGYRELHAS